MAETLQGVITIVHTIKESTPTGTNSPTSAGSTQDTPQETPDKKDNITMKGLTGFLGATSVKRRVGNYALSSVQTVVNRSFDERLFRESMYGDRRGMQKIQNQKALVNQFTTIAKSITGGVISWRALKNPVILALSLFNNAMGFVTNAQNHTMERRQFEERRSVEIYESNRRRERVNVGVYNRR